MSTAPKCTIPSLTGSTQYGVPSSPRSRVCHPSLPPQLHRIVSFSSSLGFVATLTPHHKFPVHDGSHGRTGLCSKSSFGESPRCSVPPACRPRAQCFEYHGVTNRKLVSGPVLSNCVRFLPPVSQLLLTPRIELGVPLYSQYSLIYHCSVADADRTQRTASWYVMYHPSPHAIFTGTRRRQRGRDQDVDLHWEVGGQNPQRRIHSRNFRSPENVPAFIEAVKRREKTLSGFGHRWVREFAPFLEALTQFLECTRLCVQVFPTPML